MPCQRVLTPELERKIRQWAQVERMKQKEVAARLKDECGTSVSLDLLDFAAPHRRAAPSYPRSLTSLEAKGAWGETEGGFAIEELDTRSVRD